MEESKAVAQLQRRRRYTADERVRILEEAAQPGVSIVGTAKRYGVSPSLLHLWRKNASAARSEFVRVTIPQETEVIRVRFGDSIAIELPVGVDPKAIATLLKALRN